MDLSCWRRFTGLVTALNRAGMHGEVVQLVDEKRFSLNSAAAAEYLRALVETKRLSKLAEGGAIECVSVLSHSSHVFARHVSNWSQQALQQVGSSAIL